MTYAVNFTVPVELKSPNETGYKGPARARFKYGAYRRKWQHIVNIFAGHTEYVQQRRIKMRGEFIRLIGHRQRAMDYDNLVFASKAIRDALKANGYLVDDSPQWFEYECTQIKNADGESGTIVRLWEDKCK